MEKGRIKGQEVMQPERRLCRTRGLQSGGYYLWLTHYTVWAPEDDTVTFIVSRPTFLLCSLSFVDSALSAFPSNKCSFALEGWNSCV